MMFNYYQPTKINFGVNRLEELGSIATRYGKSCLLVTTPDAPLQPLYDRAKKLLSSAGITYFHFDQVVPNPSVELIEAGFQMMKENPVDFVLAIGGGSSIDTAKALAFTNGQESINWDEIFAKFDSPFVDYEAYSATCLPLLSVPTTSGTGSQVTQAAVITRGNEKITFFHPALFSRECIVDPSLMTTLPVRMSAATGFDAFTHAFESYINPRASFYSEMDSMEAMKLVIEYLPKVLADPSNIKYRTQLCLADTLAGKALANSGASAPHPLSEIIGGVAHLPHGEALAVVFAPFVKHMEFKNSEKFLKVAQLFGSDCLLTSITDFLETIGLNKKLGDFKVDKVLFDEIVQSPVLDHLPFGTRSELEAILNDSYE